MLNVSRIKTSIVNYVHWTTQNAAKLIRPPVSEEEVPSFLWQHLQLDLLVLARAMNKNVDEAGIFLHLLIDDIHKITRTPG